MSEATLNPPSLEQINRDLATTVSEETQKNERLTKALEQIQEMAAEDLRQGRTFVCHSYMRQIEATARAALDFPVNRSETRT